MTEDTVLQQVRTARDEYARTHGYDVQKIVADLRQLDRQGDWAVVRLAPKRPKSDVSAAPNQSLEQTAAATVSFK